MSNEWPKLGEWVTMAYIGYKVVKVLTIKKSGKRYFNLQPGNRWYNEHQMLWWTD